MDVYDDGTSHATKVTSIIASDLTEGQDSNVTDPTERKQRSGIARRVPIMAMHSDPTSRVVDIMSGIDELYLLNQSQTGPDTDCEGVNSLCDDWNAMFEAGIALFNAGHNGGHEEEDDCTALAPATAMGVMASGAYLVTEPPDSIETLDPQTPRGGGGDVPLSDGNGRTIIGLLTPSGFVYRAENDEDIDPAYDEDGNFGQTSASSPSLTAAAALFREWFKDEVGDDIDAPGLLYANLLLMGDRIGEVPPVYLSSGFDNIGGAGILRLRMFNTDGIDNPGAWATGSVCVDDSDTVTATFNGGSALPAGVDYVKVVAWWYDYRHDSLGDPADFNKVHLKLQKNVSGTWTNIETSDDDDNRQRVYSETSVGGSAWRFRLHGDTIDTNSADFGCGVDSVRVYWASLWEDNARDDGGDLTDLIRPEP